MKYQAPRWLPGGHLQTIAAAKLARVGSSRHLDAHWRRERWTTPDGDFIEVDWLVPPNCERAVRSLLVLFHGLEGSRASHYARAFAAECWRNGVACCIPHFRGCGGELNIAPRAYHSGDYAEIDWILRRCAKQWHEVNGRVMVAAGVSLGGNALLRWAEESGAAARTVVDAVAAVCSPLDLRASGEAMGVGFNRWVYTRMFLNTMVPKALAKLKQHPGLFDPDALRRSRTLREFDDCFTAPLHGFRDAHDYWARCSSHDRLGDVRLPALVVNARNDPFVPASSLPTPASAGRWVELWQPEHGGHVGFPAGGFPSHVQAMPQQVLAWLLEQSNESSDTSLAHSPV